MDNQAEINQQVYLALEAIRELILDLSFATPDLQDKDGWKQLNRQVAQYTRRIYELNRQV